MRLNLASQRFYLDALTFTLGAVARNLDQLAADGKLANKPSDLRSDGYENNLTCAEEVDLLSLLSGPLSALINARPPEFFLFHHSYAESTSVPAEVGSKDLLERAHYTPAALLKRFDLDDVPYQGSFATGCAGFGSLLFAAAGLLSCSQTAAIHCLTGDKFPSNAYCDAGRARILTSDASSGFVLSRERGAYRLLGVEWYSSCRPLIPMVEVVKRSVQMARNVCKEHGINSESGENVCHYPNLFLPAWRMVSQYLKVPPHNHLVLDMPQRAHCLSSDSVISLAHTRGTKAGRIHIVFDFGTGLHLSVGVLEEL